MDSLSGRVPVWLIIMIKVVYTIDWTMDGLCFVYLKLKSDFLITFCFVT